MATSQALAVENLRQAIAKAEAIGADVALERAAQVSRDEARQGARRATRELRKMTNAEGRRVWCALPNGVLTKIPRAEGVERVEASEARAGRDAPLPPDAERGSQPFACVALSSPDGAFLAAGETAARPAVFVWRVDTREPLAALRGHRHGVRHLAFHPTRPERLVTLGDRADGKKNINTCTQAELEAVNLVGPTRASDPIVAARGGEGFSRPTRGSVAPGGTRVTRPPSVRTHASTPNAFTTGRLAGTAASARRALAVAAMTSSANACVSTARNGVAPETRSVVPSGRRSADSREEDDGAPSYVASTDHGSSAGSHAATLGLKCAMSTTAVNSAATLGRSLSKPLMLGPWP